MKMILSRRYLGNIVSLLAILTIMSGCFGHFRHRHYTFDERFEYHSNKVLKYIKKVVDDEERLARIKEDILSHRDELEGVYNKIAEEKKELKRLLLEGNDKEDVKNKLASFGDKKIKAFNIVIDIIFEVKQELTEDEWEKVSAKLQKKCSMWWWK